MTAFELKIGDIFTYGKKCKAITVTTIVKDAAHPNLQGKILITAGRNQYIFDAKQEVKTV